MFPARHLREALVFLPLYVALDWASFIYPFGQFNITPWDPQPALAIAWMMLSGIENVPVVLVTVALADIIVTGAPGGYAISFVNACTQTIGYAGMAWALKRTLGGSELSSSPRLALFAGIVAVGSGLTGA